MLVHNVFFWLREDLDENRVQAFRKGLESLRSIVYTRAVHIGTPADTGDRPVIENTYTVALTVIFENMQDHDQYQSHPTHKAFVSRFGQDWTQVKIYDFE